MNKIKQRVEKMPKTATALLGHHSSVCFIKYVMWSIFVEWSVFTQVLTLQRFVTFAVLCDLFCPCRLSIACSLLFMEQIVDFSSDSIPPVCSLSSSRSNLDSFTESSKRRTYWSVKVTPGCRKAFFFIETGQ